MSEEGGRDWEQYWRELFPKISKQDLDDFERRYKSKFRIFVLIIQKASLCRFMTYVYFF